MKKLYHRMRDLLRPVAREHAWDALALAGFAALLEGIREIYLPAALVAGGGSLVALAIVGAKHWPRS